MISAKLMNQTTKTAKAKIGDDWVSTVDVPLLPVILTLHWRAGVRITRLCEASGSVNHMLRPHMAGA